MNRGAAADGALVVLRNGAGDHAAVSLHGAQLLSWQPAGAPEQLYVSPLSEPGEGKAVRGGTPVCFPQFSDRGPLAKHGFARTARWELVSQPSSGADTAEARFQLDSSMAAVAWVHGFCLVLVVRLAPRSLELHLQAANTGRTPFEFTAALHTYLAVPDVRAASVQGLQGLDYEDALEGNALKREAAASLQVGGEIDRVYRGVQAPLRLGAPGMATRLIVQQGFEDAVVWNPGPAKAGRLGDMPPEDWARMLCIESAAIAQAVRLAPGRTWTGVQRLELAPAA